ncbi:MAG: malonyl-CoA decarboxylase N-terminal domain-containing protein [Sulfuritalea sp.]|nr:malonyl-CoA decarboxylase N-terminal domain-containing protein [Sulfuritalea sp.]
MRHAWRWRTRPTRPPSTARRDGCQAELARRAAFAPHPHPLTQFNAIPQGVLFLCPSGRRPAALYDEEPGLAPLDRELESRLAAWFVGFRTATHHLNSPAALLEKLIQYEAAHAIRS